MTGVTPDALVGAPIFYVGAAIPLRQNTAARVRTFLPDVAVEATVQRATVDYNIIFAPSTIPAFLAYPAGTSSTYSAGVSG